MDKEYYEIIKDILNHEEFQKRKTYKHHGSITVYDHSLKVSLLAYKLSKKWKTMDSKSVAIGGLLHDFYDKPWQEVKENKPFFQKHGFVHANQALKNAEYYFPEYMNKKIENIIERHMFPLNKIPPKYKEAWLITLVDKWVSLEVILYPTFFLKLIGIRGEK
jgi:uncharacterized protein